MNVKLVENGNIVETIDKFTGQVPRTGETIGLTTSGEVFHVLGVHWNLTPGQKQMDCYLKVRTAKSEWPPKISPG